MDKRTKITEQLRRNAVALISLCIAITSLGYNTWRNEVSEHNRSQRLVSIQMLLVLGELRQLTLELHYGDPNDPKSLERQGWSKVLLIQDLSQVAEGRIPATSTNLKAIWDADWAKLESDLSAKNRVVEAIEAVRMGTHDVLRSLN